MTVSISDLDGIQPRLRDLVPTLDATAAAALAGITATADDLNKLDDVTAGTTSASKALVVDTNKRLDTLVIADGGLKLGSAGGTAVGATAAELNIMADVSAFTGSYTATAPAAVPATVRNIELAHNTVAIEKTIADLSVYAGRFVHVKNTSASGTAAHTVTITTGTWDGTNKVITLNAPKEAIVVFVDSAGNGTIVVNVGSVGLS